MKVKKGQSELQIPGMFELHSAFWHEKGMFPHKLIIVTNDILKKIRYDNNEVRNYPLFITMTNEGVEFSPFANAGGNLELAYTVLHRA